LAATSEQGRTKAQESSGSVVIHSVKYSTAVTHLASLARQLAMDRQVLYHGTRYAELILKTKVLLRSAAGDQKICLTRSALVAAYFALMPRDDDDGCGSILVFDQPSLNCRYKIEPVSEVYWHTETLFHNEQEEEIRENVTNINEYLVGLVAGRTNERSQRNKMLNQEYRTWIEVPSIAPEEYRN
jgi:hypothetical protein